MRLPQVLYHGTTLQNLKESVVSYDFYQRPNNEPVCLAPTLTHALNYAIHKAELYEEQGALLIVPTRGLEDDIYSHKGQFAIETLRPGEYELFSFSRVGFILPEERRQLEELVKDIRRKVERQR